MSRQPQMLQGEASIKRQVVSVIIITGLVFGIWWSLTGILDLITGGSRSGYLAEENLSDSPGGTYQLIPIDAPPLPDIDWESLVDNLSPEDLQALMEMLGGNLDQIDPSLLASLLGSDPEALNTVMFRVYEYPSVMDVQSRLFRYSVYDSFSNSEWSKTYPGAVPGTFTLGPLPTDVTPQFRIRIPLGTITPGQEYSVTVPGVSPDTFIRKGSVFPQDQTQFDWTSIETPYVDDWGVMGLRPKFGTSNSQNMSLRTWGFERDGGDVFYNFTTQSNPAIIAPDIRSQYLGFPGGATANQYAASRPAFTAATVEVQTRFNTNPGANLFVKANMIRNYIQETFSCDPFTASSAADIVEDACQTKVGDYYGIASTYIMLARYFQIPARFATGYSGHLASESVDPIGAEYYTGPEDTVEMKLLNMYAWAETFMPVQPDGTGDWIPIDVLQVSFGDGYSEGYPQGSPPPPGTDMRIFVNGTEFDPMSPMYTIDRPATVNISVNVTVAGAPYDGPVTLYDLLEEQTLGIITATSGKGDFLWNVNTSVIAGGHGIRGTAGALMNFTAVGVRGVLNLAFMDRIPETINRSLSNQDLKVTGYLEDIAYTGTRSNNHVPKANFTVGLFTNPGMTPVANPFDPATIKTNETGDFATNLTVNPSVVNGTYYVRLNFMGMFTFNIPGVGQASVFVNGMSATSVSRTLNVFDATGFTFQLYVAGNDYTETTTPLNPGQKVNLTAYAVVGGSPLVGTNIDFRYKDARDATSYFANVPTNGTGWANYEWTVPAGIATGPVVVEAYFWDTLNGRNRFDDVYCVVNRSIDLGYSSTPTPIDPVYPGNTWVSFNALLNDSANNPIQRAIVQGVILDAFGTPASYHFTTSTFPVTDSTGHIAFLEQVTGSGAFTTYFVDLWFNNTFNFNIDWFAATHGYSPGWVQVPWFASNNAWQSPIVIRDASNFQLPLWINGTPTRLDYYNDGSLPRSYTKGQTIELKVQAIAPGGPQVGDTIQFYETSTGSTLIGTNTTVAGGWASIKYVITTTDFTGPHQFRVNWANGGKQNYTVAFVNSTTVRLMSVSVTPTIIMRGQTSISITGYLRDAYSRGIFRGQVNLVLLTASGGYIGNGYFTGNPTSVITPTDGSFAFNVMLSSSLHYGNYQIRVDFNRTVDATTFNPCPTYLTSASGFLASNSSLTTAIVVNASVQFSQCAYSPATPVAGQDITVTGRLLWDNGTALDPSLDTQINVTVWETGNPANILAMRNLDLDGGSMDGNGYLSIAIQVTWLQTFSVRWEYRSPTNFVASVTQVATGVG